MSTEKGLTMKPLYVADPYVLNVNNRFFLYSASETDGIFVVRESEDLIHWSGQKEIFHAGPDDWSRDCYWAPECHVINGKYYLFYSANQNIPSEHETFRISVAVSDTPDGEFVLLNNRPLFDPGYPVIDGSIFLEDGHIWLYYSRCCDQHPVNGIEESWIYTVELKQDLSGILGEPQLLLQPCEGWESRSLHTGRRWSEGPFLLKEDSHCYLIYSCNYFMEREYAMGYAVGPGPAGPFIKSPDNPIVTATDKVWGTGHGCLVRTGQGLKAVYHGYTAGTGEKRVGFVADALISEGKLTIRYPEAVMMEEKSEP